MTKLFAKITTVLLLATFALAASLQAQTPPAAPAGTNAPAAPRVHKERLVWSGTLSAVDKTAMTVTIKKKDVEKTFTVTSETKIHKGTQPATLEEAVIGEDAAVSYRKPAGTNTVAKAFSLRLGSPEKKKVVTPASSETSTNTSSNTITNKP